MLFGTSNRLFWWGFNGSKHWQSSNDVNPVESSGVMRMDLANQSYQFDIFDEFIGASRTRFDINNRTTMCSCFRDIGVYSRRLFGVTSKTNTPLSTHWKDCQ